MQKYSNEDIRKITKTGGGSFYVVIPKEMMKKLNWKEKQKVSIKIDRKKVVISDWKR